MLPLIADGDPDPTTQIPWPAARTRQPVTDNGSVAQGTEERRDRILAEEHVVGEHVVGEHVHKSVKALPGKPRLTTWNLITLSISMAGAQVAWTVELGYGTPFLLGLGLSEQLTSLVWLAGPISGLIAQPFIGAISDSSRSKYRRRYWIVLSTAVLVLSTLTLAYCQSLAAFFVDLFGVGAGDWDQKRIDRVAGTAIGFAIVSFYLLDFALNALQASLRNLLLDITPPAQLNAGNAWHGRMTHAGNIVGFGFGFLPLAQLPILRLLGGDQFRKFCVVSMVILIISVWITCFCHEEQERPRCTYNRTQSKFHDVFDNIYNAIVKLPKPIRRVCFVQIFAFMGWFPFLFYATTYVGQIMAYEHQEEPDSDVATRTGEFAMLIYSIVAVIAGTVLPHLASRDRRLMGYKGDVNHHAELTRIRNTVREWRAEAIHRGTPLRLPVMPFLLRNIWTGALFLFTLLTFATFFVSTVLQATIVISLIGICWAVACWVPFAIIMELLKELPSAPSAGVEESRRPLHTRALSSPDDTRRDTLLSLERQPLIRRRTFDEYETGPENIVPAPPIAGGTILGIHNLAIVMPQFIIALVASAIFRIVDGDKGTDPATDNTYLGKNGVAWVLRFGGLCTLIGAMIARMVPPTPTEKAMRRRLGEMRLLGEESSP
jgi:solute carrier family 45, member 1/2/4